METLSYEERADALIALSIVFDRQSLQGSVAATERPLADIVSTWLRSLNPRRLETLERRTARIESFSDLERQRWLGRWIDNIRRRDHSTKLDQNVNTEHIAEFLRNEPSPICQSILSYLPPDVGHEVELRLGPNVSANTNDEVSKELSPEILEVVKRRFLDNFVQIESIGDVLEIDELSVEQLRQFIRALGLREIAVACRGIESKEKVAAFLCRFAEDDAKTIAKYLSSLDQVEAIWVSIADRTVQRLWNRRLRPQLILHKIGLELLACAFAERSDTALRYTAQKLSLRDSKRWQKMIDAWKERLDDPDTRMVEIERRRAQMILHMAGKFKKTARL